MDDKNAGNLNRYMGGWQDAEEFTTPVDGSEEFKPGRAQAETYQRATEVMIQINMLRKQFDLTHDQAVQIYLIGKHNVMIDAIPFPPLTERRKGE